MTRADNFGSIEHEGIVQKSDSGSVVVRISSASACSGCHAEKSCNISGDKEKLIEVQGSYDLSPGDNVTVLMKKSMGYAAVLLGYVFPLILVVIMLIILFELQVPEIVAGLGSLAVLIPYYLILYLSRNRLSNKFTFTIKAL